MAYGSPPPPPGPYGPGPQNPGPQNPGPYGPGPGSSTPYGPGPGNPAPYSQGPGQGPAPGFGAGPTREAPLGPPSHEDQSWALMAYLGQFFSSAIAPAVILVTKGRSPYVRQHARQGLNIAIGAIVVWMVGILLILAMDMLALIPLGYTAAVMFYLVRAAVGVNRGEFVRVPSFIAWPLLK